MQEPITYINLARCLEALAIELAAQEADPVDAVEQLLREAGESVLALRRAHRYCERRVADRWPSDETTVRAFFYLSAARIRKERYQPWTEAQTATFKPTNPARTS